MKLDAVALQNIRDVKSVIMRDLPGALDEFYPQIQTYPETRKFFSSQSHVTSAKDRQINHWEAISSGQFDQNYVRAVTKVGEIHARIGLEPRWYYWRLCPVAGGADRWRAEGALAQDWFWSQEGPGRQQGVGASGGSGQGHPCKMISDILLEEYGVYVKSINYPTVPRGAERLRFTPSRAHTDAMMDDLAKTLEMLWESCNIKRVGGYAA